MRSLLPLAVLAAACAPESYVSVRDEPPVVTLLRPVNLATFDPAVPVELCAEIADERPLDELEVSLESSRAGPLEGAFEDCPGGNWRASLTLDQAPHVLVLTAIDGRGQSGAAAVTVVPEANEAPWCAWEAPADGSAVPEGARVSVELTVGDPDGPASQLSVSLRSALDGPLADLTPPTSGLVRTTLADLSPGVHDLSVTVVDPRGLTASCSATITVDPCADLDGDGALSCTDDCDDLDPTAYPGAPETPDGRDDDCDGTIDEGTVLYDDDGDGWREIDGDCDDADPSVSPGATDVPYDGVDQDCSSGSDYDQDGDGFLADAYGGTDCDDTDALVSPAGTEIWYDGVDQDCSGGSDFDRDGDGHDAALVGGGDCNDRDPRVRSGRPEVWYDGLDQDCSGSSDYDQDGDGQTAKAWGGPDCDDLDATVYVGATDAPYDGVDRDCSGGSDDDADGDGHDADFRGGDDCDDDDPTRFPGAPEAWYDGVDQDCSGGSDFDQDGDGHDALAFGGDDCDDFDEAIHPGTPEVRNGFDDDCDGRCDEGRIRQGDLVISEILRNPDAVDDDVGEWFELHNPTAIPIAMCSGWDVADDGIDFFDVLSSVVVPAGGYVVFARTSNTSVNGGVRPTYAYGGSMDLANTADELTLSFDGLVIDRVAWTSGWPNPTGQSIELDRNKQSAAQNDASSAWCAGKTTFGAGDRGSPGRANDGCP